mgnify:CR=1 FL=1
MIIEINKRTFLNIYRAFISRCHRFRQCKEQYYRRVGHMHTYKKKLNTWINKILIYNCKWFSPFISSQTRSTDYNYQATMCVLCLQWRHLFSAVGRIWQGEINKFTKSLNISSKRLKKIYFTKNSLKTCKTHKLSM